MTGGDNRVALCATAVFATLVLWQVLAPPFVGLANNGDFGKVLGGFDLAGDEADEYQYMTKTLTFHPSHHVWFGYLSSEQLIALTAMAVNRFLLFRQTFDIRVIGVVHSVLLIGAFWCLARRTRNYAVLAAAILIFSDVMYVGYLNTFYMDAAALVFLLYLAAQAPEFDSASRARWALAAALLLFATSKAQHAPLGLVAAGLLVYRRHYTMAACAAAAALTTIVVSPSQYGPTGIYSVVFSQILPRSPAPTSDLAELGLPTEYVKFSGTHAFEERSGLKDPAFRARFSPSYWRLALFYVRHPVRTWQIMEHSLGLAGRQRVAMGNFTRDSGRPPFAESQRFALWSGWKQRLFFKHGARYAIYVSLLMLALCALLILRKSGLAAAAVCLSLMTFAAAAIAGLGDAVETVRHFFLFNALADVGLIGLVAAGGRGDAGGFASVRVQSGGSDKKALHRKTRAVPGVHFLLHEDSRVRSSRIRHAEVFQSVAAIRTPDGADAGVERFHRAGSGAGSVDSSADPSGGPARFAIGVTPCTATCAVAFEPPVSGSRHIRQARID